MKAAKARTVASLSTPALRAASLHPGQTIRRRRQLLGWKSIELARRSGINPRTVNAIEFGRIKNPSLKGLESLAHTLGISMAALFSSVCPESDSVLLAGNQKGHHTIEFPKAGFRVICYLPFLTDLFIGKVIMNGHTTIDHTTLPTRGLVFVQAIIGKLGVRIDGTDHLVKEGNYLFFDAGVPHVYCNLHLREHTFLLVAAPSFHMTSKTRALARDSSRNKKRR